MRPLPAACAAVAAACLAASPAAAEPTTFHPAQYIDHSFPGGEPVLQVDTLHHTVVYSSHEGTTHIYRPGAPAAHTLEFFSEYRNQTKMWVSDDHGANFRRVDFAGTGFASDPTRNSGFSDPDFAIDAGGRIYNTGINLANDALFSSADGGRTWDRGTVFCASADRPWLAGGRPDEAFMSVNLNVGGHQIFQSTDGGNSCSASGIPSDNGNGKLYYDHVGQRLVEPAQGAGSEGQNVGIAVWKRGDAEFTYKKAVEPTSIYAHWPAIALDGAGGTALVWDTDDRGTGTSPCGGDAPAPNRILMAYTPDFGETWSKPVTIAAPPGKRVFWPWVAAGDRGKLSIVWYQTDRNVDVACENADISIHHATVLDAHDDATRAIEVVDAVGRPISKAQNICQSGTTCVATGEDRRLGDFFTNAIDERGCAIIASGDTMLRDAATGGERMVAAPLFVRQATGPRLIGEGDCSGRPASGPAQPPGAGPVLPPARTCRSHRKFKIHIRAPRGQRLRSARIYVDGRRGRVIRRHGRLHGVVDLRGLRKGRYRVKVVAITGQGRRIVSFRRYHTCKPKKR